MRNFRWWFVSDICIPFVSATRANAGNKGTTGQCMTLVEFPNLAFDFEAGIMRVSNVKFIPPGPA
jgi:hypothetical protein